MTPQTENGVGEEKVKASTTSGGEVNHSPTICTTTAKTKPVPIHRCMRRPRIPTRPGKSPAASKGWINNSTIAAIPAKPATI